MQKARGVSMLELMVVLAIILVMMAIMLPVFIQAKNRATGGACFSNLRQIHQALEIYSTNNGGGVVTQPNVILPSDLSQLNLGKVAFCKGSGIYQTMWMYTGWSEYAAQNSNPILIVDPNNIVHNGYVLGLYRNGNINKRRAEGDPMQFRYWE